MQGFRVSGLQGLRFRVGVWGAGFQGLGLGFKLASMVWRWSGLGPTGVRM